ncbi:MAG: cytochrome c biogenesis protein ResB [Desulfobacca sp.]|uniref:cytochrome c biogenesis protein ResB n=1 Tax=Desulfobacca sp. TaxID=2067990 RepID=UPI00404AE3C9
MWSTLWQGLTSIRLALLSLLLLGLGSILGTLLPQRQAPEFYQERFGTVGTALIGRLGLDDVYRSPIFLSFIALLLLNLIACSLKRLPEVWRQVKNQPGLDAYKILPPRLQLSWNRREQSPQQFLAGALPRLLGRPTVVVENGTTWYLVRRGRWGRVGPYLIHLSIIIVMIGAIIGSLGGFQGQINLMPGEVTEVLRLTEPSGDKKLDFGIRLDNFQVSYYPNGTPQEFRSDLTFLQSGQPVKTAVLRVNDPVTFGHLTFYQSTYQAMPRGPVVLEGTLGDKTFTIEAPLRQRLPLPDDQGIIMVWKVESNIMGLGQAVQLAYRPASGGHPLLFWVLADTSRGQPPQPGPHTFRIKELALTYSSGLLVKYDPGVWWVYLGFLLMLPGFWLALFVPRQRWAIAVVPQGKEKYRLTIAGVGDRHKMALQRRLEKLQAAFEE